MKYHLFWKSTHYICENINCVINLKDELGGGFFLSDVSPFLLKYIDEYRKMV